MKIKMLNLSIDLRHLNFKFLFFPLFKVTKWSLYGFLVNKGLGKRTVYTVMEALDGLTFLEGNLAVNFLKCKWYPPGDFASQLL